MHEFIQSIFASAVVSASLTAGLIWLSKTWISERLKKAIKNEYDQNLETHKAILKAESDTAIAKLQFELKTNSADRDARRDYEYEARKRLYQEYEPLLFQLVELSEYSLHRINSLARTARQGDLADTTGAFGHQNGSFLGPKESKGWLSFPGYYMISTVYEIIGPIAIYKLMQRRLRLVDLRLDPGIDRLYTLSKILYLTLTCDFEIARNYHPEIEYDPNVDGWEKKRESDPSKYWRQGVPLRRLDVMIDELLTPQEETTYLKTYGEYEKSIFDEYDKGRKNPEIKHPEPSGFFGLVDIFLGFHPRTRPVLWRILVTQTLVYRLILKQAKENSALTLQETLHKLKIEMDERNQLDWRGENSNISDEVVLKEPFSVATEFVRCHLKTLEGL